MFVSCHSTKVREIMLLTESMVYENVEATTLHFVFYEDVAVRGRSDTGGSST